MGSEWNGRAAPSGGERQNLYALVIYIPDPLGGFLDDLRRELAPHCNPHAHVSVLPPRCLSVPWSAASEQARTLTEGWAPFEIELTSVEVFPATEVIYIEIGRGALEMRGLHSAMNTGALECNEPFVYHPHSTLAQGIPHDQVEEFTATARRRWAAYTGSRVFRAERAVFVQNAGDNCWIDLAEYSLGGVVV
jgi:2'-5' RNA ligase